jgi:hypothetical protein
LDTASLENYIATLGLRSIVNLRGSNPDADWYDGERALAERYGLTFYDVPTDSACPTPDEVRALVSVLGSCGKPVLLHCQSGIDRSGPASAIAILLFNDDPQAIERGCEQLGLRYGHLAWGQHTIRQRAFLSLYQDWLAENKFAHSMAHFSQWALEVYDKAPD